MSTDIIELLILLIPLLLQLIGLTLAVLADSYISKAHKRDMLIIVVLIAALLAQNVAGFMLDSEGTHTFARALVGIFGYSIRPVVILMFFYLLDKRRHRIGWMLVAVNALVHLTAVFSGIAFRIDENNNFIRGPLGYTCHIVSAVLLAALVYTTIHEYGRSKTRALYIPLCNAAVIVASVVMDSFVDYRELPLSCLTIAVVSGALFYYIWLHLQFVREHEEALMAQQRIQIMMSQIQPHFLYNTLATIQSLCRTDPLKASEVTGKFAAYLRQNLDSLKQTDQIPIEKELEHTRLYAEIEEVRFPKIHVEYDIKDDMFNIPALTIQPLVENAIRHGIRGVKEGWVKVSTIKKDSFHEITVQDNGKGFDISNLNDEIRNNSANNGAHIGLSNVKSRIEEMCHGTLSVESSEGEGTKITIRIPYGGENN